MVLPPAVKKVTPNDTEINDNKYSEIYSFPVQPVFTTKGTVAPQGEMDGGDGNLTNGEIELIREQVSENIGFAALVHDNPFDAEEYEEYLELITEILCADKRRIRIAGDEYPTEYVKERFWKLDYGMIQMVHEGIRENITRVRNYKQYVLAALFNAPTITTIHYRLLVNHDMAQNIDGIGMMESIA